MSTRGIIVVKNKENEKIVEIYKHFDCYPDGLGNELIEFITPFKIVNGLGRDDTQSIANGMSCFAAQLIAHFKDGPGGIYLYPPTEDSDKKYKYSDKYGAEYYYEISQDNDSLKVECWDTYTGKEIPISLDGTEFIQEDI